MSRSSRIIVVALLILFGVASLSAQEWVPFGPPGGHVAQIVEDPVTGTLYLYGRNQGLYRLKVGETTWEPLSSYDQGGRGRTARLIAYDDDVVAVRGCCEPFHSRDGGTTWLKASIAWWGERTMGHLVRVGDTFYVPVTANPGESSTLNRSVNGGAKWSGEEDLGVGAVLFADDRWLFDATSTNLQRRVADRHWSMVRTGPTAWGLSEGNTMVIGDPYRTMFVSIDGGKTWTESVAPPGEERPPGSNRWYRYSMALRDDTLWAVRGSDVAVMRVGDTAWRSWRPWGPHQGGSDLPSLLFTDRTMLIYGVHGTLRWDAAADRFVPYDDGQHALEILRIMTVGDTLVVTVRKQNYDMIAVSGDEGATWETRPVPTEVDATEIIAHRGVLYTSGSYLDEPHRLHYSSDLGRTWTPWRIGLGGDTIKPNCLYARDDQIFIGAQGVVRVTIGTDDWELLPVPRNAFVTAIVGAPRDTLFAITTTVADPPLRSTDGGDTWVVLDTLVKNARISRIAYANGLLSVGTVDDGLFRSFDGGESWINTVHFDTTTPPPDHLWNLVNRLDVFGDTLFVHFGRYPEFDTVFLYASFDRGESWTTLATPPGISHQIHPLGTRLLAATEEIGIQVTQVTVSVDDDARTDRPGAGSIGLLHDPTADHIRWSTPAPTSYSIDLYTLSGAHVMTMENGTAEAGEHVAALPELAGGVYLCTIRTAHGDAGILVRVE